MSNSAKRAWRFYIVDMIEFVEKVLEYTEGMDRNAFIESGLVYDATVRNIELIGEAATHIPIEVRKENEQIPWRQMIATRNILIHAYLGIDNDILWSIISTDIPDLLTLLNVMKDSYS